MGILNGLCGRLLAYLTGEAMDEGVSSAFRKLHADGTVCVAESDETCPKVKSGDRADEIGAGGEGVSSKVLEDQMIKMFPKLKDPEVRHKIDVDSDSGKVKLEVSWRFPVFKEKYTDAWFSDFGENGFRKIARETGMHMEDYSIHTNPIDDIWNDGTHYVWARMAPGLSDKDLSRSEQRAAIKKARAESAERTKAKLREYMRKVNEEEEQRSKREEDVLRELGLLKEYPRH